MTEVPTDKKNDFTESMREIFVDALPIYKQLIAVMEGNKCFATAMALGNACAAHALAMQDTVPIHSTQTFIDNCRAAALATLTKKQETDIPGPSEIN